MKYELFSQQNDFITASFSEDAVIDARIYSVISHNSSILIPGTRDLSVPNIVNYDTLGSIPMLEELQQTTFTKRSLHKFLIDILDVLEKIFALGINERQIIFDCSYMYVSLYDKSIRFICLPICGDGFEPTGTPADVFKTIALTVKSDGAYELIGYIIEKTASENFSVSDFKAGLVKIFTEKKDTDSSKASKQSDKTAESSAKQHPGKDLASFLIDSNDHGHSAPENVCLDKEYVPAGIPFASGEDKKTSDAVFDDKTQVLFANVQDNGDIPYLSPVDNNSPEARIYIAGERLTIGRSPENDLHLNISTISGKHAEIHRSGNYCTVTDLNSTNKTYVNGTAIRPNAPIKLNHQDLIAFNKTRYRFFEH